MGNFCWAHSNSGYEILTKKNYEVWGKNRAAVWLYLYTLKSFWKQAQGHMFAGVDVAMQNVFYTSPDDRSLAEQLLPIGSYGQEPILNVCKLGSPQNDAAKSRWGHGFLQIGWWVGPTGNRAVFLRKCLWGRVTCTSCSDVVQTLHGLTVRYKALLSPAKCWRKWREQSYVHV